MLNAAQIELQRRGRERGIGERLLARIVRLNPSYREGDMVRGWHPAPTRGDACYRGWVGKRHFIREHGRAAWNKLPRSEIRKNGRRKYVTWEAVQDRLWMLV